ncbi:MULTISPECIES: calcium-binding protein [unclassified Rhizobium]|uniref:calcium-binding protein n=1 Tax=unclassified Rhizobium TaxID=2613769 RepID=UPI001AD9AAB9|nr:MULTISPECIES: cadherin-like domain-containing protein [unclassified Rhizobium]MBO9127190.1 cadherin-like domain-containing protein [Rhizobium sp. 16-488-2b]MBO9177637.1 cadherin-like domain-containing protein [Rhizobium sp. 16-488-2a]
MIEAKGTKSAKDEDPQAKYLLKNEDVRSKAPAFVAMLLTGIALYLKSALSSDAAEPSRDESPPPDEPEQGRMPPAAIKAGVLRVIEPASRPEAAPRKPAGPLPGGGSREEAIDAIEWPPFMFQRIELSAPLFQRLPAAGSITLRASNDNIDRGGSFSSSHTTGRRGQQDVEDERTDEEREEDEKTEEGTPSANRAPRVAGPVTLLDVSGCAAVLIGLSDLLRGASDPDGDALQVTNVTVSSGTIVKAETGWLFDWTELGGVTVNYVISDGKLSVAQTAHFAVVTAPPIVGTDGGDLLLGTDCADVIDAMAGDDNIDTRSGADTVHGGGGNDNIVAGSGDDIIFAGLGDDVVFGGAGNDQIHGGAGRDRLWGDEGNDVVFGDEGDDFLSGGSGDDRLFGNDGNDTVSGDSGDDVLDGGDGNDALSGGEGDDTLLGQEGRDTLSGGDGDDVLTGGSGGDTVAGGAGADSVIGDLDAADDYYDGGDGLDTLDYSAAAMSIVVDLLESVATGEEIGSDNVASFEVIRLGSGSDTVTGSAGDETVIAGAGEDRILDGGGADLVYCGDGDDIIIAASDGADDRYDGEAGSDTVDYSQSAHGVLVDLSTGVATGLDIGSDILENIEQVIGTNEEDVFTVGLTTSILQGGGGNDVFQFTLPSSASSSDVIHHILDFMVGDRIETSAYRIFEELADDLEDHFEAVYGQQDDDDAQPIRVRHEGTHELSRTLIEIDADNNQTYEMTINLSGHHMLVVIDAAA